MLHCCKHHSPLASSRVCKHETDGVMLTLLAGCVGILITVVALYVLACVISAWFGRG